MTENLTFQNLLKNRKLLPAEKFENILAFDKEFKRKLQSLKSAAVLLKVIGPTLCEGRMNLDFMTAFFSKLAR